MINRDPQPVLNSSLRDWLLLFYVRGSPEQHLKRKGPITLKKDATFFKITMNNAKKRPWAGRKASTSGFYLKDQDVVDEVKPIIFLS